MTNTQQEEWELQICICKNKVGGDFHFTNCPVLFVQRLLLQARKEAREETLREVINILNYPGADADYNVQKIFDLLNEQEARRLCDVDTCEGHNQYEVITW